MNPGRDDERVLPAMADGTMLKRGDILRIETGGGGGWGHPFDRDPLRVLKDVLGGFVSAAQAQAVYGVVLAGTEVDEAATQMRRQDRPSAKLFHRFDYTESFA